ncbi:response regulator transcription factor [Nocardioides sp. CFH 31398]|uniref:response regulator n=1 Tax=Nocardioides sp. CFH 31398 TaxID=2919579 RepID=UPI001F066549|nr:response regulator transcription factor [Nocardioides sp. CFH 31398]MCH1865879.1 response regulator transcription factor [Nocardioides sp. CFH 31398]
MSDPGVVTVVVADDEEIVREGLAAIVGAEPGLRVVATAADGAQAVAAARRTDADVVLMDVRMPGVDGIEATRRLAGAAARVLVLTTVESDEVVVAALRAGASGFLLKSAPRDQLYAGIRAVAAGEALLAPSVTRRLIESVVAAGVASAPPLRLTGRQRDVVRLVAAGLSNPDIARRLHLAPATVKGYVSDVLLAHDLRDRAQLVVRAYESGLVRPGDAATDPA